MVDGVPSLVSAQRSASPTCHRVVSYPASAKQLHLLQEGPAGEAAHQRPDRAITV